jgi:hypothetical protein
VPLDPGDKIDKLPPLNFGQKHSRQNHQKNQDENRRKGVGSIGSAPIAAQQLADGGRQPATRAGNAKHRLEGAWPTRQMSQEQAGLRDSYPNQNQTIPAAVYQGSEKGSEKSFFKNQCLIFLS